MRHGQVHEGMPLEEAAKSCGLSSNALRLRWRRGTIHGYKAGRRLYIDPASLPAPDRVHSGDEATANGYHLSHAWTGQEAPALWQQLEVLRQQVLVKDDQIKEKDRQIEQLHRLMDALQQRLPPPPAEPDAVHGPPAPQARPEPPRAIPSRPRRRKRDLEERLVVQLIDAPDDEEGIVERLGSWIVQRTPRPLPAGRSLRELCRTLWQGQRGVSF